MMRSGLVHWVKTATAERIQKVLETQTGHSFINITELGITLNTADVEGVYTQEQYGDVVKLKQGMFQCEYRKWHGKKETCDCKREREREHAEVMRQAREREENRELTPEERAANLKRIREIGDGFRAKGFVKGGAILKGERTCVMCPNKCPGSSRYYCSGGCLTKAKEQGIYGHEEELSGSIKI